MGGRGCTTTGDKGGRRWLSGTKTIESRTRSADDDVWLAGVTTGRARDERAQKAKRPRLTVGAIVSGWLWTRLEDAATGRPRHSWRDQRRCQRV